MPASDTPRAALLRSLDHVHQATISAKPWVLLREDLADLLDRELGYSRLVASLINVLPIAMNAMPRRGHEGACGPEAGCDGICMEVAAISESLREAYAVLALVRGPVAAPKEPTA